MMATQQIRSESDQQAQRRKAVRNAVLVVLALVVATWLTRQPLLDYLKFIADRERFSAYIKSYGLVGPAVLFALQVAQVIVALFPGYAFFLAAGYIYGVPLGFLLNLSSIVVGSQICFLIGRHMGRPVVNRLAPSSVIDRWDSAANRYGFRFFFFSFLLPIFPADTMNYVAGLSSISGRKFFLASVLGRAPSILLHTIVGASAVEIASWGLPWWAWGLGVLSFLLLYAVWQVWFSRIKPENLKF